MNYLCNPFGSASSSKTAKQVLRLAMMQVVGALSQKAEPNAPVKFKTPDDQTFLMTNLEWFSFALVVISLMAIVFYMMGNTSESESEEDPESRRRRYLFSSLDEVSDPDQWMALNHHDYSSSSQDIEPEVETDAAGPRVESAIWDVPCLSLHARMFSTTSTFDGHRPFYARSWMGYFAQFASNPSKL